MQPVVDTRRSMIPDAARRRESTGVRGGHRGHRGRGGRSRRRRSSNSPDVDARTGDSSADDVENAGALAMLYHHRWTAPALCQLHRLRGAKFITLVNKLGASRPALKQTLNAAIEAGWARPNPGHGHPMRPEYLLTDSGSRIAPPCQVLIDELSRHDWSDATSGKWSMPVISALSNGPQRFTHLRRSLGSITDRALTLTLRKLEHAGLIDRWILDGYPPGSEYSLTATARSLVRPLDRLCSALREADAPGE